MRLGLSPLADAFLPSASRNGSAPAATAEAGQTEVRDFFQSGSNLESLAQPELARAVKDLTEAGFELAANEEERFLMGPAGAYLELLDGGEVQVALKSSEDSNAGWFGVASDLNSLRFLQDLAVLYREELVPEGLDPSLGPVALALVIEAGGKTSAQNGVDTLKTRSAELGGDPWSPRNLLALLYQRRGFPPEELVRLQDEHLLPLLTSKNLSRPDQATALALILQSAVNRDQADQRASFLSDVLVRVDGIQQAQSLFQDVFSLDADIRSQALEAYCEHLRPEVEANRMRRPVALALLTRLGHEGWDDFGANWTRFKAVVDSLETQPDRIYGLVSQRGLDPVLGSFERHLAPQLKEGELAPEEAHGLLTTLVGAGVIGADSEERGQLLERLREADLPQDKNATIKRVLDHIVKAPNHTSRRFLTGLYLEGQINETQLEVVTRSYGLEHSQEAWELLEALYQAVPDDWEYLLDHPGHQKIPRSSMSVGMGLVIDGIVERDEAVSRLFNAIATRDQYTRENLLATYVEDLKGPVDEGHMDPPTAIKILQALRRLEPDPREAARATVQEFLEALPPQDHMPGARYERVPEALAVITEADDVSPQVRRQVFYPLVATGMEIEQALDYSRRADAHRLPRESYQQTVERLALFIEVFAAAGIGGEAPRAFERFQESRRLGTVTAELESAYLELVADQRDGDLPWQHLLAEEEFKTPPAFDIDVDSVTIGGISVPREGIF